MQGRQHCLLQANPTKALQQQAEWTALHSADLRLSICGQAGGIDDGLPSLLGELILADALATGAPVGVTLRCIGGK